MNTADFLHELARQIKRHPQSYPSWLCILADDVIEARDNIEQRQRTFSRDDVYGDPEAVRRFFGS